MKLDRLGGFLKFPKQPYGIKGTLFWRKHFFTALDTVSDATCWRVSLRHSLAHSQLDIHHTYIQPGTVALFIKDPCGTRAADEWVFAGRQCEITRLLFFIAVSAKRYSRAHTPRLLRDRVPILPPSWLTATFQIYVLHRRLSLSARFSSSAMAHFKLLSACDLFLLHFTTLWRGAPKSSQALKREYQVCLSSHSRAHVASAPDTSQWTLVDNFWSTGRCSWAAEISC